MLAPATGLGSLNDGWPASIFFQVVLRGSSLYLIPIIIVRSIGRYTARFERSEAVENIWVWPIAIPFSVGSEIVKLLMKLFDLFVARMSRKIIAQDEEGTIYTETRPHTRRTKRKDRLAVFVQVKDHTGTHNIRLDPALLKDSELTPHDAIASTFNIEPDEYRPVMQT